MSKDQEKKPSTPPPVGPGQWLELNRKDPQQAEKLWQGLDLEKRMEIVLQAGGEEREKLITLASDAPRMVLALPPDEFSRTILELEADQAGTLLTMCSPKQLQYLMDLTGWVKEKFSPVRYQYWVPLLLEAGAGPLNKWLKNADLEALALLFAQWFEVVKFVPSQDEQEPPDDLPNFTLDGIYYLRFRDDNIAQMASQVLVQLKSELPSLYAEVLEAILWEPASLMASQALRWRNGRMSDHGFPLRLEALDLWAKPAPGEDAWREMPSKDSVGYFHGSGRRSGALLDLLPPQAALPVLGRALAQEGSEWIMAEAAYIANCAVVALDADPADPAEVKRSAREGLGLVNLGLGLMSQGQGADAGAVLARMPMTALARQGAQAIRELNLRAHVLVNEGWMKGLPTGLHILDSPLDRALAGLIFPRPRCYDSNLTGNREYRSFMTLADLEQSRRYLEMAEYWGVLLFELMGIERTGLAELLVGDVWPSEPTEIKLSLVLGTWLARRAMGLSGLAPIEQKDVSQALAGLKKGLEGELAQEVMASCQGISNPARAALASELLRGVLNSLEEELRYLNLEADLDPSFIRGLVVRRPQ